MSKNDISYKTSIFETAKKRPNIFQKSSKHIVTMDHIYHLFGLESVLVKVLLWNSKSV